MMGFLVFLTYIPTLLIGLISSCAVCYLIGRVGLSNCFSEIYDEIQKLKKRKDK